VNKKQGQNRQKRPRLPFISPWRMAALRIVGIPYFHLRHRVKYYGQQNIPSSGPFILVSNHPTYMDPFLIGLGTKRWIHWLAWDELWDWPIVGDWISQLGSIPVNLDKPGSVILKQGLRVLRNDAPLGIFFEGGRSTTPKLNATMPGAAMLAIRTGTTILPVTISGAYKVWPVTKASPQCGPLTVFYHPPLNIDENRIRSKGEEIDLTKRLHEIIEWPLRDDGRAFRPSHAFRHAQMALKGSFTSVKTELETPLKIGNHS
jgi:1-acyl-sn-glycerol-3-phosphate acyltransferase